MRKLVGLLRFGGAYVRLVRDLSRLDLIFALGEAFDDSPGLREMLARAEVQAYLKRPPPPMKADLSQLRAMPEGSLGRVFAGFLEQRGLDPQLVHYHREEQAVDDATRIKIHLERTHDLWHTVLGIDSDVAGELGLQSFMIAQLGSPLGVLLLSAGLLNGLLFAPADNERRMAAIAHGWRLGRATRPLFGADWATMLTWPIEQVREHFGMVPADLRAAA